MKKIIILSLSVIITQLIFGQVSQAKFPKSRIVEENEFATKINGTETRYNVAIEKLKPGMNCLVLKNKQKVLY